MEQKQRKPPHVLDLGSHVHGVQPCTSGGGFSAKAVCQAIGELGSPALTPHKIETMQVLKFCWYS